MMTGDLMLNLSRTQQSSGLLPKYQKKVDSLRYNNHHTTIHHHHNHHNHHHHNSVPSSPNEMGHHRAYKCSGSNSASTSPVGISKRESGQSLGTGGVHIDSNKSNATSAAAAATAAAASFGYSSGFVRTSRSEDHLQFQKDPSMSAVDIDIDDDVTSSLNTLLDTRPDSGQGLSSERIVWTYNAPVSSPSASERTSCCQNGGSSRSSSSSSGSSMEGTSPQRSLSPASPTSVSSSVMSSNSGSRRFPPGQSATATTVAGIGAIVTSTMSSIGDGVASAITGHHPANGDLSQSEAISNMSSPDYNDEETMDILSARDIMMVSDPSDSDSTILASEPPQRRRKTAASGYPPGQDTNEHRIVIQVKGPEKDSAPRNTSPRQPRCRGNPVNVELMTAQSLPATQNLQRTSTGINSGMVVPENVGYQVVGVHYLNIFKVLHIIFF